MRQSLREALSEFGWPRVPGKDAVHTDPGSAATAALERRIEAAVHAQVDLARIKVRPHPLAARTASRQPPHPRDRADAARRVAPAGHRPVHGVCTRAARLAGCTRALAAPAPAPRLPLCLWRGHGAGGPARVAAVLCVELPPVRSQWPHAGCLASRGTLTVASHMPPHLAASTCRCCLATWQARSSGRLLIFARCTAWRMQARARTRSRCAVSLGVNESSPAHPTHCLWLHGQHRFLAAAVGWTADRLEKSAVALAEEVRGTAAMGGHAHSLG